MRTLLEVTTEITTLAEELKEKGLKKSQVSRKKNRIEFLKLVKNYLETGPNHEYIGLEISKLENKINILSDRFNKDDYKDPREAYKKYEKDSGITHIRTQIKTLRYIYK